MTCDPFTKQLEHLTALATSEFRAWQVYAWQRAKDLEASKCGQWVGLPRALEQKVSAALSGGKPD